MGGKHKDVKNELHACDLSELISKSPGYRPKRGSRLFNMIESALADEYRRKLTLKALSRLSFQSISTIFGWRTESRLDQIETLLFFLERLPETKGWDIIRQSCRTLPTLSHYSISWNETQASTLAALLRDKSGLSIIQSKDSSFGYVASALGHSNSRLGRDAVPMCGIDHRSPERFVPVDGVLYLENPLEPERIRKSVLAAWPAIRKLKGHLVLLTGCLAHMHDLHRELLALTKNCHVVIAEQSGEDLAKLRNCADLPCHVVTTKQERDGRISINVQRF